MKITPEDRADIEATEFARQTALTSLDVPALERLLAEDLVHVHSTGMVHGKQEFIAHVQRMGGFRAIDRGPLDIRIEGAIAIVTGRTTNGVRSPETGEDVTLDGFSTLVMRKGPTGWQIILSQLTPFRGHPPQRS